MTRRHSAPHPCPPDRFLAKVAAGVNGCWIWTGAINADGYGNSWHLGRCAGAHRVSYLLFRGEIPVGLEIDHRCRIRRCVNPQHLQLVTHVENVARRPRVTHCPYGHEFTPENTIRQTRGRACRTCAQAKARERVTLPDIERPKQSHCTRGHELTPENTYIRGRYWRCRECCRGWERQRRPPKSTVRSAV